MSGWWNGMVGFQQVLFVIACATTLFMIVQIILLVVGGDADSSYDTDMSIDEVDNFNDGGVGFTLFGLRIFSVRGIVAFFAIGSWLTLALFYVWSFWAIIPGVIAGVGAAIAIAFFIKQIEKLQNDGTLHISNSVGKLAEVYLTIPANREGNGKINVFVQERYTELEAITDEETAIPTGAKVKIIDRIGEGLVIVEKIKKETKADII